MVITRRILIILTLGLSACTSAPSVIEYDWTGREVSCESELMQSDSSLIGVAGLNMVGADEAVLYVRGGDYCLSLYRVDGDSLIWQRNLLRRGRGPGEAMNPMVHYMPEFGKLCVFRNNMASTEGIYWLDSVGYSDGVAEMAWDIRRMPDENPVRLILPVDTARFLADAPFGTEEMFGLYTYGKTEAVPIGLDYPEEMARHSFPMAAMALSGFVAKRPGSDTFVYSSQHGHFVRIFDIRDDRAVDIRTVYNEMPRFASDDMNGGIRFLDESQLGFWVFATEKYIYLLDAGMRIGEMRQGRRGERTVNVFDWDGRPVRKLRFDRDIGMFSVAPDDRFLYFNAADPDSGVEQIYRVAL